MKNVYPIIFSFSNTKIPRKSVDTYKDFIKELFKENGYADIEIPGNFPLIIRLKEEDKNNPNPEFIKTCIEGALKAKLLVTDEAFPKLNYLSEKIIVIDFLTQEAIDSKNEFHFLYFIDSLLEKSENTTEPIKFVLISNRIYDESIFDNPTFFERRVHSKQVLIYDNFGHSFENKYDSVRLFKEYRKLIFGDAYELFKRKLIGKVGHFKRYDSNNIHERCHLFFYDGSHCEDELKAILKEKFSEVKPDFIIYDCPESPWLKKAISLASPYFSATKNDLLVIQFDRHSSRIEELSKGLRGILIFDLTHKENRITEVYNYIKKSNPYINLNVLSILKATNSINKDDIYNPKESITTKDGIEYNYIYKVFQKDFLPPTGCKMCSLFQIPGALKFEEIHSTLQAYFFWLLFDDPEIGAGYNYPEKDTPENRNALAIVPNFKELLSRHGPYLAYKMKRLLDEFGVANLKEYTFICPNEDGAKEVGKSIGYFFEAEIIRIDKSHVKEIIDNVMTKDDILRVYKDSEWTSYLTEETGKSKTAIIFDEFALTSNTLQNYSAVVQKFGFEVLCYFPLFSFADLKSKDLKPIYSLYKFNLFSANPIFNNTSL